MSDQQHDAIDLTVDVGAAGRGALEPGTVLGDHGLEMADDLLGLYQMMLDPRPRFVGGHVAGRRDRDSSKELQGEQSRRSAHR
jgi:hypothetical protein